MSDGFPRYTKAASKGEKGVQLTARIVTEHLGWIFKRNPQEFDFGIDGQIEIVGDGGAVYGQMLAVQIKYGDSFLKEKNEWGIVYRGETKHFNYLSNYPLPVIIVVCDPSAKKAYWVQFKREVIDPTAKGWKITIPYENDLATSKEAILELLPPPKDALAELRSYWATNKMLQSVQAIVFTIEMAEVLCLDTSKPRAFFDRLRSTREMATRCEGKVEFAFSGYDEDPRELYEVEEVRDYVERLINVLPELLFFVGRKEHYHTLRLFSMCLGKVLEKTLIPGNPRGEYKLRLDPPKVLGFMNRIARNAYQIFEWLKLPEKRVKSILSSLNKCLGLEAIIEPRK